METPLAARDQWIELAKPTSDALRFESAAGRADSRTDLFLKEIGMGTPWAGAGLWPQPLVWSCSGGVREWNERIGRKSPRIAQERPNASRVLPMEERRRSMAKPKTHIRKDDRNPESSVGGLRRTLCGLFIPLEQLDNANPSCQKCLQFRKKAR